MLFDQGNRAKEVTDTAAQSYPQGHTDKVADGEMTEGVVHHTRDSWNKGTDQRHEPTKRHCPETVAV